MDTNSQRFRNALDNHITGHYGEDSPGAKESPEDDREAAITELRGLFRKAGYKAYTVLDHVSKSGMMRYIKVFLIIGNGPVPIDHIIARLGSYKRATYGSDREGLKVHGCGMDLGFDIVYNTSRIVFKDAIPRDAPQRPSPDAGYVVSQEWI